MSLTICPGCCSCEDSSDLVNTGKGVAIGDVDPNWTGDIGDCTVVDAENYRVSGRWSNDDLGASQWISVFGSTADSDATAPQENTYTATFTFDGDDPADAAICFRTMADNCISDISINGSSVYSIDPADCDIYSFQHWNYWSFDGVASPYFVTGANNIVFTVYDEGDVAGFRLEWCPLSTAGNCWILGSSGNYLAPCTGTLQVRFNDGVDFYVPSNNTTMDATLVFGSTSYPMNGVDIIEIPVMAGASYAYSCTGTFSADVGLDLFDADSNLLSGVRPVAGVEEAVFWCDLSRSIDDKTFWFRLAAKMVCDCGGGGGESMAMLPAAGAGRAMPKPKVRPLPKRKPCGSCKKKHT